VQGNKTTDIGKSDVLLQKHPDEGAVDLTSRIMFPGLVSTYIHTAQTLLRGMYIYIVSSHFPVVSMSIYSLSFALLQYTYLFEEKEEKKHPHPVLYISLTGVRVRGQGEQTLIAHL
jgi:hypothetical protein